MKKLLLLITLLIFNYSNSQESWFPLGPDDFNQPSFGKVNYSKIQHDNNNVPYVVFSDVFNDDKLTVKKYINNEWTIVGSPGFSGGPVTFVSIDFDSNNMPYVAYKDTDIKMRMFDGTNWINLDAPNASTNYEFSFKISTNNIPYIAFQNSLNTNKATVKKYNNGEWELVGIDGISVNQSNFISLAINSQEVPYIIYSDASIANKVSVQKFENNSWSYVGQQGLSLGSSSYTNINFDNNNIPAIIYSDGSNNSKLTMQIFSNNIWQTIGQNGFSTNSVSDLSFDFDSTNKPYVICKNTSSEFVEIYYYGQSQWNLLPIPTTISSSYPSISLAGNDDIMISIKNNNGGFLEVKKLINNNWSDIGNTSIVISELSKYAIDNSGTIYMLYKSIEDNKAYLKKYENGVWSNFSINPISSGTVNSLDIEIDNNNQICVVFTDSDLSGNRFLYKRYNGNDFTTLATSNYFNVNLPITNLNLKFDSNNTPFFAMNYGNLIIQKFDNNSWTTLGYLSSYDGEFDIVIDKNIVPNILYVADKSSSTIRVKKYENSSFVNVGSIINPISVDSEDLSLTIINNQVYIAYRNTNQGGGINYRIFVKKYNGTDWEEIGNLSNNSINFDNPLLRSNNNNLYLFYNNKSNGFANLINYENDTWSNIGSNNFSSAKSNNSDLLFFNSTPIVLYTSDTGVFGKYYGIENALSIEDFNNVLNVNTFIYPNPVLDKFKIKSDDFVIDIKFYDITGKEIQELYNINDEIDISNFKKGIYLLKIQLLNSTKTLKLIKK